MAADIRVAVFGAGEFGESHVRALQARDGVQCVGLVDPDVERVRAVAQRYGVGQVFSSAVEAVEWGAFDAACLVTPAETHADIAELVAPHCAALLIEKPVLQTSADAERLRAVGMLVPVLPGHISRFAAPYRRVKQQIDDGAIGEVVWISARRYRGRDHAYRFTRSHIAHTTMIHDLDLCVWFSGTAAAELRSVATKHVLGLANPDQVTAVLEASTGATWCVQASWLITSNHFAGDRIEVFGTEGQLAAEASDGFDLDEALAAEHAELARSVRTGEASTQVTLEEGIASIELADRIAAGVTDFDLAEKG